MCKCFLQPEIHDWDCESIHFLNMKKRELLVNKDNEKLVLNKKIVLKGYNIVLIDKSIKRAQSVVILCEKLKKFYRLI